MGRSTKRRSRILATAGVVAVVAVAIGSVAAASSGGSQPRPHLPEHRILAIAERAAARAGDPHPTLIQHAQGTRHDANHVDSGDGVPGRHWSYLIAERGHFVVRESEGLPGSAVPRGSVLTLVVNASTGRVTDSGVSDHYPNLAKLGPVHTDLRHRPTNGRTKHGEPGTAGYRYAVEIQAGYDRSGNPSVGTDFVPNGGLAKPHWSICSPPNVSYCTPVESRSQFIQPGPTAPGTVFQASATFKGHTYTARSAVWTGQVQSIRPPWLDGQPRVGARVDPKRAAWRGGWRPAPGYRPPLGMFSGGRGRSFESLSVEACRAAAGTDCVNLTPQGQRLDFAQHPITVPRHFVGWYLFAFDEHFPADTAWAQPAISTYAIPPLKVGATVARSVPVGPVRG